MRFSSCFLRSGVVLSFRVLITTGEDDRDSLDDRDVDEQELLRLRFTDQTLS